jgi:hypothetical protein
MTTLDILITVVVLILVGIVLEIVLFAIFIYHNS